MRTISWPLYVAALVISIAIFLLGFYFASIVEKNVKDVLEERLTALNEGSLLVQLFTLTDYDPSYCPLYREALDSSYGEIDAIGKDLTYLEEVRGERDAGLKKRYFLFELKTLLLAKKVNEVCGKESPLLIYVYENPCDGCGPLLDEIEKRRKEEGAKVFSFESGIGSSVVESIMNEYNISKVPSLVEVG